MRGSRAAPHVRRSRQDEIEYSPEQLANFRSRIVTLTENVFCGAIAAKVRGGGVYQLHRQNVKPQFESGSYFVHLRNEGEPKVVATWHCSFNGDHVALDRYCASSDVRVPAFDVMLKELEKPQHERLTLELLQHRNSTSLSLPLSSLGFEQGVKAIFKRNISKQGSVTVGKPPTEEPTLGQILSYTFCSPTQPLMLTGISGKTVARLCAIAVAHKLMTFSEIELLADGWRDPRRGTPERGILLFWEEFGRLAR